MNSLTPESFAELRMAWIAYCDVAAAAYPTADYWRAQARRIDVMHLLFDRAGGLIDTTEKYDRVEAELHHLREIVGAAEVWRHWWLNAHGKTFVAGDPELESLLNLRDAAEVALEHAVAMHAGPHEP